MLPDRQPKLADDAIISDNIRREALSKLRDGDYDFAIQSIGQGKVSLEEIVEDIRIYQAELEIQNEQLLDSQRRTETALRRFQTLFSVLPLPALVVDAMGLVQDGNAQAEKRLRLSRLQLKNHFFPRFFRPAEHRRLRLWMEQLKAAGEGELTNITMRTVGGESFIADIHATALPDQGSLYPYFAVLIVDQTDLVLQQRDLLRHQELLNERIKELRVIYAVSRLAQQSHELEPFLLKTLECVPTGMLYANDAVAGVDLAGKNYPENARHRDYCFELTAGIQVGGARLGELWVAYTRDHADRDIGPFLQEKRDFIDGIAEQIGNFYDRWQAQRQAKLVSRRNAALLELTSRAAGMKESELLQFALEQAEQLTGSAISYTHFVNADQESLTLGLWSANTLKICNAVFDNHYPLSKAGIWADCVRQRRPVVHNDYANYPHKHGLPEGHAPIQRHLSVPVIDNDQVVMIIGVGNKAEPYDEGDQALLEMVANNSWALLQRNRALAQLSLNAAVFRHSREGVIITDGNQSILSVNRAFTHITGFDEHEAVGETPRLLKSGRQEREFYNAMWQEIMGKGYWQGEIWNRRKSGEVYPQWMSICVIPGDNSPVGQFIGVFSDISDRKEATARIEFLASHDPLTDLPNRSLVRDRTRHAISRAERNGERLGMIFIDLDHFKNINDTLGHPVGDKLLVEFAERLNACVRESDTVSRLGGDEFMVLLENINQVENLTQIADKILELLAAPFAIEGNSLTATCSMGICVFPDDGKDFDTLMKKADTALYQAKERGRNNYQFFTEEMNRRVLRRLRLESEMRLAFDRREFYLEYQPQFDLATGRLVGVEALIRWNHPKLGRVAPGEFIPVAEDSGFILEIGRCVLREACRQNRIWFDKGHRLRVAVNVSSVQFGQDRLLPMVCDALGETSLPRECLELELTESILVSNTENNLGVVKALREMGVHFSIDDFGTGYSNLSYLKRFAVSKLKIDKSFIRDIPGDKDDEIIVSAIINMAESLGIVCIAEGVETPEQLEFLKRLGCHQAQGFLLGLPLPALELENLLDSQ